MPRAATMLTAYSKLAEHNNNSTDPIRTYRRGCALEAAGALATLIARDAKEKAERLNAPRAA